MALPKDIPDGLDINRFLRKLDKPTEGECWIWKSKLSKDGYGVFQVTENKKQRGLAAHRVSYKYFKGALDLTKVIDHTCRTRACVNPAHLRQVTFAVNNVENSDSWGGINSRKTTCKYGHSLEGVKKTANGRVCQECKKLKHLEKYKPRHPNTLERRRLKDLESIRDLF